MPQDKAQSSNAATSSVPRVENGKTLIRIMNDEEYEIAMAKIDEKEIMKLIMGDPKTDNDRAKVIEPKIEVPDQEVHDAPDGNQLENANAAALNFNRDQNNDKQQIRRIKQEVEIITLSDSEDDIEIIKIVPQASRNANKASHIALPNQVVPKSSVRNKENNIGERPKKLRKVSKYEVDDDYEPPENTTRRVQETKNYATDQPHTFGYTHQTHYVPTEYSNLSYTGFLGIWEVHLLGTHMKNVQHQEHDGEERSKFLLHQVVKKVTRQMEFGTLCRCFELAAQEAIGRGGQYFEDTIMNISIYHPKIENGFVSYKEIKYPQFCGMELAIKLNSIKPCFKADENLRLKIDVVYKNHRENVLGEKTLQKALIFALFARQTSEFKLSTRDFHTIRNKGVNDNPFCIDPRLNNRMYQQQLLFQTATQQGVRIVLVTEEKTQVFNLKGAATVRILKIGDQFDAIHPSVD